MARVATASWGTFELVWRKILRRPSCDGPRVWVNGPVTARLETKYPSDASPTGTAVLPGLGPLYAGGRPTYIRGIVTDSQCSPAVTGVRNSAHSPFNSPPRGTGTFIS